MKSKRSALTAFAFAMLAAAATQADVKMPEIFGNEMVLQRECKVPVWGRAAAGEKVTVSLNGQTKSTETDQSGNWKLELDPMTAGGPFTMTVKGNNEVKIDNVLVGEVWLCSGQSNMEWIVKNSIDGDKETAEANYPNIRLFHVPKFWTMTPQTGVKAAWKTCTPATIPGFSAIGYFFGRELNKNLNIPVGLINSSWGGTRIEPWTPPVGFESVPVLKNIVQELLYKNPATPQHKELLKKTISQYSNWISATEKNLAANTNPALPPPYPSQLAPYTNQQQPTVLYNGMINPLVPYAIRGAIWYQGESNRGDGKLYFAKMQALIDGWRKVFNNPEMPFYFVQLAPYNYGSQPDLLALIWEAQSEVTQKVPNTGMAVINDIGNLKDIHPRNKQEVGRRLALIARNRTYGQKDLTYASPEFKEMKIDGEKLVISFGAAKELKTRDGKAPTWFEIAGKDGVFAKANATISGTTVILTNDKIKDPVAMRFSWHMLAEPNLVNEAGLPAGAFRAGEIPERGDLDTIVPEAKAYKLVYSLDPTNPQPNDSNKGIAYKSDKSKEISGKVTSIGYFLSLVRKNGSRDYVFVTMDPFTQELGKIGVPVKNSGARFQTAVKNLTVKSNVKGVENGSFPEGNIEFWDCNYGQPNSAKVPGASETTFDFGDMMATANSPGYGSMQVHNTGKKQTVFSFNNWGVRGKCDVGIGNNPQGQPDWTFTGSAASCSGGQLLILVKTE